MWIIYALLSALTAASRRTTEKQLTTRYNHFTIAFATQLLSLPIIAAALLLFGSIPNIFDLSWIFWLGVVGIGIGFYPLNAFLYLQALKHDDISNVLPIQSLGPFFSLLLGLVLFQEVPTIAAAAGVTLIILGVYALGLTGRTLHHPLKPFYSSVSSRYMLACTFLATSVSVLDKFAIAASNALFYSFASTAFAAIVLAITMHIKGVNEWQKVRHNLPTFGTIGTLQGISYSAFLLALASGPLAYVSAIRSSNILIGSLLGVVILKESLTWQKIMSLILICCGGAVLANS